MTDRGTVSNSCSLRVSTACKLCLEFFYSKGQRTVVRLNA